MISAAEFPSQPDPHEKIAELRRQIAHEIEKLSPHDPSPSVRRLRKWLQLEIDSDAEVRERLWRRESMGPLKGGQKAAQQKPARTRERNEQMKQDYIVARTHDGMTMPEATKYLVKKHDLTKPQVCRIVKPRALERKMRAS